MSGYSVHKITAAPMEDICNQISLEECVINDILGCEYHVASSTCQSKAIGKFILSCSHEGSGFQILVLEFRVGQIYELKMKKKSRLIADQNNTRKFQLLEKKILCNLTYLICVLHTSVYYKLRHHKTPRWGCGSNIHHQANSIKIADRRK